MSKLIIVESPAKAKTIKNFLGKDYEVIASKGHIRDLPKSSFGIKIEDDKFIPEYRVDKDHSALVKDIKAKAKKADIIYIATDEDREGEAIGFHIAHAIGKGKVNLPRIVFHEITKTAIVHAIQNPRELDMAQVNAQQTRRLLDRIVGYKLSPLISSKIQRGLSAGRVQSSALKIVVDKDREIEAFVPVVYFTIDTKFDDIEATLIKYKNKKIEKLTISTQEEAKEIVDKLIQERFTIAQITNKTKTSKASPPFMTSTLQQGASSNLGYSPKKTMMVAQKLYEGVKTDNGQMGIITYMRTDSLNISKEAIADARGFIKNSFGDKYLPSKPKFYATKSSSAQEAHEAIRPVRVDFTPKIASKYLSSDELRVYTLIYNRFLASQMSDAIFDTQTILIDSQSSQYKLNGKKLKFDGFYRVYGNNDKDRLLPNYDIDQEVKLTFLEAKKQQTQPPSIYSEASLIKTLEANGIGRPSTYAPTITILQSRDYISIEKKQITPSKMAFKVIQMLEEHFEEIVDSSFTANMEDTLDLIAQDKEDWQGILAKFYTPFMQKITDGKKNIKSQKVLKPTGEACPECGEELVIRGGRYGEFISCSTYPKCKYTKNIDGEDTPQSEATDKVCDKCGEPMVIKNSRRGKFYACSAYPKCKNTKPLVEPRKLKVPCPKCGGDILERSSKRGKFFGCANYPDCDFISKYEPTDATCPKCNATMVKKVLKKGEFLECSNKECKEKIQIG